jgi:cytochrome c5
MRVNALLCAIVHCAARRRGRPVLVVLLAGCGGPPPTSTTVSAPAAAPTPTSTAQIAARAATLAPTDARLSGLYEHSCKACHAEPRANAPLAGDRAAWRTRLAKGKPALLRSVLTGFNAMPAGGQCFTCTPRDYEALISFMADEDPR